MLLLTYLFGSWRHLNPGPLGIDIVSNDGSIVTRSPGDPATVSGLFFQVWNNGTFRHTTDGHDVSNSQLGFLTSINKLSAVHAFGGDKEFLSDLVFVRVPRNKINVISNQIGCQIQKWKLVITYTVFPHSVAAATSVFWNFKTLKISWFHILL